MHGRCHGSEHCSGPSRGCGRGHSSEDRAPLTDDATTGLVDIDWFLSPVGGIWKEDEEPDSILFTYEAKHSSNVPFTADTSPVELFYGYFTEDVWALLVTETNQYA